MIKNIWPYIRGITLCLDSTLEDTLNLAIKLIPIKQKCRNTFGGLNFSYFVDTGGSENMKSHKLYFSQRQQQQQQQQQQWPIFPFRSPKSRD